MSILLGAYAAKQCPVRVHNDYSPSVPPARWEISEQDQVHRDAGDAFEADVFSALLHLTPGAVRVDKDALKAEAIATTLRHMDRAAPLILGGWLPDDHLGGRTGRPDLLVRVSDGYLPGDVKHHTTLAARKTQSASLSTTLDPGNPRGRAGWSTATNHRADDGMQLAHYTRLLQACGRHAGDAFLRGAIIGKSLTDPAAGEVTFVWHDLDIPLVETFSRSEGKTKRSLLDRYDHEHVFRVKVAQRAMLVAGRPGDPDPLVDPVGQEECETCPYQQHCVQIMGPDEPSQAIVLGRLDTREWLALRALGITTTAALADLDLDEDSWLSTYTAEVTQHSATKAKTRLAAARDRARMIRDGITHYRTSTGPVDVPTATLEIDIDIENDVKGKVYMWGARTRRGTDERTAIYHGQFTDWEPMTVDTERALAERFVDWLRDQREQEEAAGGRVLVFHWSHPEWSKLHKILGRDAVADLTDPDTGIFRDVEKVFNAHYESLLGSSIKKVAPLYGFDWTVDDAGGAQSQAHLHTVHTSTDPAAVKEAKAWLLAYNEDDNAAMAAVRDGIRDDPNVFGTP